MSVEFGPALHNIARVIFCTENIDLAQQYREAGCMKLLVWDKIDEVIPERASVKQAMLDSRWSHAPKRRQLGDEGEQEQLNEEVPSDGFR